MARDAVVLEDWPAELARVRDVDATVDAMERTGRASGWSREETLARTVIALAEQKREYIRTQLQTTGVSGLEVLEPKG